MWSASRCGGPISTRGTGATRSRPSSSSDGSLADIPARLEKDGAPPLFYFLLNLWTRVFGTSATSTHALTTTLSLLTVAAAWWIGRRHSGRVAGLLAAAAIAVNPYLVLYSTETRNYALFALLGVVAAGFMLDVLRESTRWAHVALGVTLGLTMLTHVWGLFFAASMLGVLLLVAFVRRDRDLGVHTLVAGGVAALVFLPWLPTFVGQLRHTGAPWNTRYSIFSTVDQLVAYLGDRPVAAVVALAVLAGAGAALLVRKLPIDPVLVAAASGLTLAMAFLVSYIEPIWQARYGIVVLGVLLLVAGMIGAVTRVGTVALVVAIAAMLLFTVRDVVDRPVAAKSRPLDHDGAEIIDVREGRPGRHKIAERGKKAGRIVVGKKRGRIEAEGAGTGGGVASTRGARGVVGQPPPPSVPSVSPPGPRYRHAAERRPARAHIPGSGRRGPCRGS